MDDWSGAEVLVEIATAEHSLDALGLRERRLWDRMRIAPQRWTQTYYSALPEVWVVAVVGTRCLLWNPVESGWGWGRFETWGVVREMHWQQDEIQHVVYQTLFAIDHGGQG
ncbi:MAG: hypothetical protein R3B82_03865 [Sandaracinaceae bacterium]